jgi:hypothetical protein
MVSSGIRYMIIAKECPCEIGETTNKVVIKAVKKTKMTNKVS